MPRHPPSRAWLFLLVLAGPARMAAQASPLLPTDDPRMPLIEHLISRGEVRDPAPLERPFRTSDIARALRESSSNVARRLAAELTPAPGHSRGSIGIKAGPQAYSQGRRELIQDGGNGNVGGYAELQAEAVRGPVVLAGRGALDTRLSDDPDYPARGFLFSSRDARIVDLYLELQGSWGEVHLGQVSRNWGPSGIPGVPISDAAYPRSDLGLGLGRGAVRLSSIATRLRNGHDATGGTIERYYLAHRLAVHLGRSLTLAAWEVGIVAGAKDQLDGTTRAVVPLLVIPALVASKRHRNEMVGGDVSWRPSPRWRIEAQLAIDDWNFDANNPYPQRWAGSVSGAGALGRAGSWRASYTTASSLAFRTLNPQENIVDQEVGIGRLFPDNEIVDVSVGIPVRETWLVTPRLALLRQGEGRIQDPFPAFAEARSVPARFIGITASSFWAGFGLAGGLRRLQLAGEGGLRHTRNAGHVSGRTRTTFEGRVTATLGFTLGKANQ